MQIHKPAYCCLIMQNYIETGIITIDKVHGTAHINARHTTPATDTDDQDPTETRIPVSYCTNCGDPVKAYSEIVPTPTYTRATANGGACDDKTCRFQNPNDGICSFAFRGNAGCYSTDDAVKTAYAGLRSDVRVGWNDFVNE